MTETATPYPPEVLGEDDDDGTMVDSKNALAEAVVGHRIVSVERAQIRSRYYGTGSGAIITLDNGKRVKLVGDTPCQGRPSGRAVDVHLEDPARDRPDVEGPSCVVP